MVLLDKLWDDVLAGPHPDKGLGKLRGKISSKPLHINPQKGGEAESSGTLYQRSASMPTTPITPLTPNSAATPTARKANVWRSVFHPGSNINTKTLGSDLFDKPQPNSPTVYDWMYSGETRSKHR
ncbi:auxin-repressed 12.5 kDa protein isoform X1 [Dendrobium catenatum]|uniref:auxin-repressed 12.5 kDa protein isoform X1 n=1 Tax=Dendrobium catenatum TaxID=906689 RepID=UPI0009F3A0BB|nr:auxin-repressed 12.5 kDa protein isoform X1 [Dendrobium catenatum]